MQARPPRRRRARPVADAPIDTLLLASEDLTKGWLLSLLEQASLDEVPAILAVDLARDGPRLCDAVVRAIADDTDLRLLEPGGAFEPLVAKVGELAGAQTPEEISCAVDTLLAVLWSAFRRELRDPGADQVAELAQRLALVGELVRCAALRRHSARQQAGPLATTVSLRPCRVPVGDEVPIPHSPSQPPAVIGGGRPRGREPAGASDALWVGALQQEIEHSEHSSSPLSLLLAELDDADRVSSVETPADAATIDGRFAQAVRGVVRRQDILVCETDTRAWIIARETGRDGAQALGSRVAQSVGAAPPWRGASLSASVGLAVLGEDGRYARELMEAAEEAQFAARARGIGIVESAVAGPGDLTQDLP